jgi:DEAD/DEAH box helicase domain-containing protein
MINSSVLVQENYATKTFLYAQEVEIGLGEVEVTDRVIGYRKIQTHSNEIISTYNLEIPPTTLKTIALWIKLPDRL